MLTCVQRLENAGHREDMGYVWVGMWQRGVWHHLTVCAGCYKEVGNRVRGRREEQDKLNSLPSVEASVS